MGIYAVTGAASGIGKAVAEQLIEQGEAGDQVVIHFSGHGGRASSIYPADIKPGGIDEGFVPTDLGTGEGRYIRDLQLAYWLKQMADKGLLVTAILDCCHSGGMTRGDAAPRGIEGVDTTVYAGDSAETNPALLNTWQELTNSNSAPNL